MGKAAQGFLPEAYLKYVEGGNPRRTPLIGKITIYGWKLFNMTFRAFGWACFFPCLFLCPVALKALFIHDLLFFQISLIF